MNIIEEQNMNGETNRPLKANSEAPNVVPSAKKVYSKPVLHVLLQHHDNQGYKTFPEPNERTNGTDGYNPS